MLENIRDIQNIDLYNSACGDEIAFCNMLDGLDNSGQSYIANGNDVKIKPLDSSIPLEDIKTVDFIKIDTEGYELKVLIGAGNIIEASKPIIMVELNGLCARYGYSDQDVIGYLNKIGYVQIDSQNKDHLFAPSIN